jgi:hypothetical protein
MARLRREAAEARVRREKLELKQKLEAKRIREANAAKLAKAAKERQAQLAAKKAGKRNSHARPRPVRPPTRDESDCNNCSSRPRSRPRHRRRRRRRSRCPYGGSESNLTMCDGPSRPVP